MNKLGRMLKKFANRYETVSVGKTPQQTFRTSRILSNSHLGRDNFIDMKDKKWNENDYSAVKAYLISFGFNQFNVEPAIDEVFKVAQQTGTDCLETARRMCANMGKPR